MLAPYAASPVAHFDERNLALSTALQRHVAGRDGAPREAARGFVAASLSVVVALALLSVWRNRGRDRRWAALHDVAVVLGSLLLISPKTWVAHYVWLFPLLMVLAAGPPGAVRDARWRVLHVILVVAGLVLVACSRGIIGRPASELVRDWSVPTACAVLLWLATLLARPEAPSGAAAAAPPERSLS
jgi:hypothetical protein